MTRFPLRKGINSLRKGHDLRAHNGRAASQGHDVFHDGPFHTATDAHHAGDLQAETGSTLIHTETNLGT